MRNVLILCALIAAPAIAAERVGAKPTEETYFAAALRAVNTRNYAYSQKVLQYLVRLQPTKTLYWFNLGNILVLAGQHRAALGPYRKVVDLGSPLAPVAWLYSAKCYRNVGELPYAAAAWSQTLKVSLPPNLASEAEAERVSLVEAFETKGGEAYRAGDYDGALRTLVHLERLGSLSADAKMLRGMCLMKKGQTAAAQAAFQAAGSERAEALEFQRQALEQAARPGTGDGLLRLQLTSGYDSNLYGDGQSEALTSSPVVELSASVEHGLGEHSVAAGSFQLSEKPGLPAERFFRLDGFGATAGGMGNFRFYFYPRANLDFAGASLYLSALGAGLGVETGERNLAGLFFQAARTIPFSDEAAYLLGTSQIRKLYFAARRERFTTTLALMDQVDGGLDLTMADGVLPMTGRALGPMLTLSWRGSRAEIETSVSYFLNTFENIAVPENQKRLDRRLEAGARYGWRMDGGMAAHFSVNYVKNRSTLGESSVDDKNFAQWIAKGGFSWQTSW